MFNSTKTRFWFIELKFVYIVWIFKKIRHLIKILVIITIIYIDHNAILNLIEQITFIVSFIDKLNLRFIRVSNYIQRFNLKIRHKSNKMHIISNAFSRLINLNINFDRFNDEKKLNVLFIITLIHMKNIFRKKLLKNYFNDSTWKKIIILLNQQKIIDVERNVFFIEKTISFFVSMIISLTNTHSNLVDFAYFNRWYLMFSIQFMTTTTIIQNSLNIRNAYFFYSWFIETIAWLFTSLFKLLNT